MGLDIDKSHLHAKSWHFSSILGGAVGQKLSTGTLHMPLAPGFFCYFVLKLPLQPLKPYLISSLSGKGQKYIRFKLEQYLKWVSILISVGVSKPNFFFVFLFFFVIFFGFLFFHFFQGFRVQIWVSEGRQSLRWPG